ncbi:MAG TPA: SGNH/GDSL hydrolase family protein [Candidatus Kryptobacter bacterium]|nr:SGNH/GDSL hydrolase family protein [Candidatus Kryptobacter bacterium]
MTKSDRIVFLGDSITELGAGANGYVTLVGNSLKAKYGDDAPEIINAGISGNKVTDLQSRLDRDVISRNPTMAVVYIGINDVWHFAIPGHTGTPMDLYESGLRSIVARLLAPGAKVILCTPSVIGEKRDGTNPQDNMLNEYSEISRAVAKAAGICVCDLRREFTIYLNGHNDGDTSCGVLTVDGVHLNDAGNRLVARAIFRALGV